MAGAETFLHTCLTYLQKRGAVCDVYARDVREAYTYEGVGVYPNKGPDLRRIEGSQMIITHLDMTGAALNICRKNKIPITHLVHNSYANPYIDHAQNPYGVCVVYNSDWIAQKKAYELPSCVVHPPVFPGQYRTETTGEYITLINVNENKGGFELVWLAERFPEYKFMGVMGAYDSNGITGQIVKDLPNLTYIENTPDVVEKVYAKTRILIMPSKYESYGRTAIEAGISGIPVLHNVTPGLMEALGTSGVSVPQRHEMVTDMELFSKELRRLMEEPEWYAQKSKEIREHCEGVCRQTEAELNTLYIMIEEHKKGPKIEAIKNDEMMKAKALRPFSARIENRVYEPGEIFEETADYIKTLEQIVPPFAHRIDETLEIGIAGAEIVYDNKAIMPKTKRGRKPKQ
jgi:hypothetical protein